MLGYSDSLPSHIAFDKLLDPLILSSPLSKGVSLKKAAPHPGIQCAYIENIMLKEKRTKNLKEIEELNK